MRNLIGPAVAAALLLAAPQAGAEVPANIAAALADKSRPEADVARDAARKPGEVLALAGVKPGDKVADFIMGGGYFTRILAAAVGPSGQVYAYQPAEFIGFRASYGESLKKAAAEASNVTPLDASFQAVDLPDGLDLVLTVQNYHDLHVTAFPVDTAAKINAEIFKSLKPGGVFLVIDHAAASGSGLGAVDALHRIDAELVKKEVQAAGFKLESESPLLHDAADTHTVGVFDPAMRGKTDQFTLKFVKPN